MPLHPGPGAPQSGGQGGGAAVVQATAARGIRGGVAGGLYKNCGGPQRELCGPSKQRRAHRAVNVLDRAQPPRLRLQDHQPAPPGGVPEAGEQVRGAAPGAR
ncbi:JM17 [macacine gammaherpesvirus 11]|uniref:JM17 n=2 Tax=macacine gammaherpesvirus 11 TaxID=2560570 RepID=G9JM25_9GAMA|nr:JM17 [Macaca fuscata rhadinovirus]AAS99994.1 JM17 [Macaca fuscata rhadinovirus]AEW87542.1 JM17 [Macaca fuscata rhadinovirus]AEW87712.1 JM17 [Macaca fuscata rhadinovirus]